RQRLIDRLREAGDVGVQLDDTTLHIRDGVLVGTAQPGQIELDLPLPAPEVPQFGMMPRHAVDEALCLARTFDRTASRLTVLWWRGRCHWPMDEGPETGGLAPRRRIADLAA